MPHISSCRDLSHCLLHDAIGFGLLLISPQKIGHSLIGASLIGICDRIDMDLDVKELVVDLIEGCIDKIQDRKSTRLNSSHNPL